MRSKERELWLWLRLWIRVTVLAMCRVESVWNALLLRLRRRRISLAISETYQKSLTVFLVDEDPVSQASPCLRSSSCCWWVRHTCHGFWLENDFRNELFEGSKYLLLLADKIDEIKTICQYCKKKATWYCVHRMDCPFMMVSRFRFGGNETYISVCRKHILRLKSIRRMKKNEHLWSTTSCRKTVMKN